MVTQPQRLGSGAPLDRLVGILNVTNEHDITLPSYSGSSNDDGTNAPEVFVKTVSICSRALFKDFRSTAGPFQAKRYKRRRNPSCQLTLQR